MLCFDFSLAIREASGYLKMGPTENEIEKEQAPPQPHDFPEGGVKAGGSLLGRFVCCFARLGT